MYVDCCDNTKFHEMDVSFPLFVQVLQTFGEAMQKISGF